MVISVKAYAKINLFLDIEGIRDNGYHNILSLMQSVTLHDKIDVEYDAESDKDIEIICDNDNIPCDRRNLAYKAAELILESGKVKITIEKSIPSEAGLAGGSADAAATLVGLNALLGRTSRAFATICGRDCTSQNPLRVLSFSDLRNGRSSPHSSVTASCIIYTTTTRTSCLSAPSSKTLIRAYQAVAHTTASSV